jgi:phage-related protein
VVGTGDIEISLGGYTVGIDDLVSDITLDCEAQNAYSGSVNLNSTVTLADGAFPQLAPGANSLTIVTGSVTSITITPRWWQL